MKTISKDWIFEILDTTNKFSKALINDHFSRHPDIVVIPDRAKELLNQIYCDLWVDAYYDKVSDETAKFSKPIADKMTELNDILHFKQ